MRFGNLKSVPWYLRLIVFVFVAGFFYAGFWYFVTSGTRKETKEMEAEIAQLLTRNAQAQIASAAAQRVSQDLRSATGRV